MLYIVQKTPKRGKTGLMSAVMVVEAKSRPDAIAQAQAIKPDYFENDSFDSNYKVTRADPLTIGATYMVG